MMAEYVQWIAAHLADESVLNGGFSFVHTRVCQVLGGLKCRL